MQQKVFSDSETEIFYKNVPAIKSVGGCLEFQTW